MGIDEAQDKHVGRIDLASTHSDLVVLQWRRIDDNSKQQRKERRINDANPVKHRTGNEKRGTRASLRQE